MLRLVSSWLASWGVTQARTSGWTGLAPIVVPTAMLVCGSLDTRTVVWLPGPFQSQGGSRTASGWTLSLCALPVRGSFDDHSGQAPLSRVRATFLSRLSTAPLPWCCIT